MPNDEKEKLEFLKREEVRTMAKDLARLREEEAKEERERIAKLKLEEEVKLEQERLERIRKEAEAAPIRNEAETQPSQVEIEPPQVAQPKEEIKTTVHPVPAFPETKEGAVVLKPPSSGLEKVLIRIFLVAIFFFIATFLYWYFAARENKGPVPQAPQKKEQKKEVVLSPEELLAVLPLEKKAGQLFIIGFDGEVITPEIENIFKNIPPGGVILFSKNIKDKAQTKALIDGLQRLSEESAKLPLLVAVDQEGGIVNRIPFLKEQTAQDEIQDETRAFQTGLERGKELKQLGFNLNLAPVLDQLNPGDFLYPRSFKKDAETAGRLGKAIIEGQKEAGILTAIKHFPGYAGISFDPEETLARILNVPEISQFQEAAKANPEFVMISSSIIAELDPLKRFLFSEKSIGFLRQEIAGNYLIMTDDLSQNVFLKQFSLKDLVAIPINSGVEVLLFTDFRELPQKAIQALVEAVKEGVISQDKIDQAVLKIIKLKQKLR